MSSIEDFNKLECELIPAAMVNAYVLPKLNPLDQAELIIESSWGEESVDLTPAVKKAETVTHMKLSPEDNSLYLEFDNEAGEHECIYGDDLSKIISLMKLKDVNEDTPEDGDTVVFDENTSKFILYPLVGTINALTERVAQNEADIVALQTSVQNLTELVNQIITKITPPTGVPTSQLVFGDVNLYSDSSNSGSKAHGFFTHNPSSDVTNDLRAA